MNYYLPPLLLTLAALAPLLRASLRRPAAPPTDNQSEQRALIAAWREQSAADPANQDEHDYRLYHELKNLRDGKPARAARPPRWMIPAMLLAAAAALLLWQLNDTTNHRRWYDLTRQLAPDHPLYRLIPADGDNGEAAAHAPTITVHIHPDTLATLPANARLYVSASLPGERMPIAVRATAPALTQTLQLTDRDSMTGESLATHPQLTYRAILSADGNVSGQRLAEKQATASGDAALSFELP